MSGPVPSRDDAPQRPDVRYPCRADWVVIWFIGGALLSAIVGVIVLLVLGHEPPPALYIIASSALTALVSLLPGPAR